jgi:outer membrane protein assembly factor BamB
VTSQKTVFKASTHERCGPVTKIITNDRMSTGSVTADPGDQRWSASLGRGVTAPTIIDETVFAGGSTAMYALDAADGSQQWRTELNGGSGTVVAVADYLFVGTSKSNITAGGSVYALDADSGDVQWRSKTAYGVSAPPTVADGTVYAASGERESAGHLYALDTSDGSEQWRFENSIGFSSVPTVADGTVFVGDEGSSLLAVDAADGTKQWDFSAEDNGMDSGIYGAPTVAGDTVFFGNNAGFVYAMETTTGTKKWRLQAGPEIDASPTVVDGTVFVGSNRTMYALDAGVDGSSSDSRVLLGTLGHHGNRKIPDVEVTATSNNTALKVGGVAAGLVGTGYLLKRRYNNRQKTEFDSEHR